MALVTAFSEGNFTQIAWAPSFVIELDSQEYEVSVLTSIIRANRMTNLRSPSPDGVARRGR
jgi:hypothetical protein